MAALYSCSFAAVGTRFFSLMRAPILWQSFFVTLLIWSLKFKLQSMKKTAIGLISKKAILHVQHTSFVHLFAVVLHDYNVNFQKLPSYRFYGGNVARVLVQHFFFTAARSFSPWWPLALLIFWSPPQIFHLVLPTKNVSLFYVFRSSSLSLFFSLSSAGLSPAFSLSLSLSFSIFQICGHDN